MRRIIILTTAIAAGLLTAAFAENGMWLPALIGIGWNAFLLIANARKSPVRQHGARERWKPKFSISILPQSHSEHKQKYGHLREKP